MSIVVNKTRLPVTQWQTKSGSVVSISDARKRYAKSLSVALEPIQSGSGDPSPDNVRPISGHDSVKVTRTGKNLFNPHLYQGGSYNPAVGSTFVLTDSPTQFTTDDNRMFTITPTSTWKYYTMVAPIKADATYYRSGKIKSTGTQGISEGYLDADFKVLSKFNNTNTDVTLSGTLKIPSDAKYYYLVITNRSTANVTLTVTELQLELGSTATAYEPYQGISVTLSLGQTVYGGSVNLVSGAMRVTHSIDVYNDADGFATWGVNYRKTGITGFFKYSTPVIDNSVFTHCNMLPINSYTWGGSAIGAWNNQTNPQSPYYMFCFANDSLGITAGDSNATALSKLDAFLMNTPMTVCKELATPQTIQLSPNQIEMLMRNNTVWSDAGVVTLEYARIRT